MITLKGLHKVFFAGTPNEVLALKNINLEINEGDFITVIGSNGAGKSTLLKVISGVEQVDTGIIELGGDKITDQPEYKRAKDIGRIDQDPMASTASDMTIEENLAMALLRGKSRGLHKGIDSKRGKIFVEVLSKLEMGLEERLKVPVGTLSGGQRQALALVMATVAQPRLLLLDEHTAALDPQTAKQVMFITNKLVTEKSLTTLMITHNMEQAIRYGNRLIMMHRGQIILDINQEEKARLTTSELIEKFAVASGSTFDYDRVLLAKY